MLVPGLTLAIMSVPPTGLVEGASEPAAQATSDLSSLARSGLGVAFGLAINGLLTFMLAVVVSRALGASGTGTFYVAVAIFSVLTIVGQLGSDIGLLRAIPMHRATHGMNAVRTDLWVSLYPVAIVGSIFGLGLAVTGLVIINRPEEHQLAWCLIALSPFVMPVALSAPIIAATRGLGSTRPFVVIETIAKPGLRLVAVALVTIALSSGVVAAVSLWGAVAGVTTVAGAVCLRRMSRRLKAADLTPPQPVDFRRLGGEFWRFAGPRALGSALQVTLLWVDVIILEALRGPTEAGVYSAAVRYLALGTLALSAAILVVAPQVSDMFARREIARVATIYRTSTLWLCVISLPIVVTTAVFAPTFMTVFGHGFTRGAPALAILSVAMAINVACGPVNTILLMGGGSVLNLINIAVALILNLALNLLLIPSYGFNGSAAAWAIAIVITNIIPLVQVHRRWQIHPGSRGLIAVCALAIGIYATVGLVIRLGVGVSVPAAGAAVVASTALYLLGLWKARSLTQLSVIADVIRGRGQPQGPGPRPAEERRVPAREATD